MSKFEELERTIRAQQKGKDGTDVVYAGEQILDICRGREDFAGIVLDDLKNPDMAIEKAVLGIREHAKQHKQGNVGFCSPKDADRILRKFYGIPEDGAPVKQAAKPAGPLVNILDFI